MGPYHPDQSGPGTNCNKEITPHASEMEPYHRLQLKMKDYHKWKWSL